MALMSYGKLVGNLTVSQLFDSQDIEHYIIH